MASADRRSALIGKTVRWTFDDGPVAGKTFEHSFGTDGTISYRSAEGYTLTVLLDFDDMGMVGFGSNSEVWTQQHGSFVITQPEESS